MAPLFSYCNGMEQYSLSTAEVLKNIGSGQQGLTAKEAERRLAQNGRNALKEPKKRSIVGLFFAQFKDLMTIILICAAFLSAVLAFVTKDKSELADTGILFFIILLNAIVGLLQQYRADAAIDKLKKLSVCHAKVVRDGRIVVIDAAELVVGDIIELEEGDRIPADCRILSSENFRCDESSLTGESKPVKKYDCIVKKNVLAERDNTAHFSTFCVKGRARCVVVATGMDTEMGKIANLIEKSRPVLSPLDKVIAKLGKIITATVLSVAAVLFLGGLLSRRVSFLQNVMSAVAVAVAAIPEGMGAVVTIILAMGVQRMSKARAVMRKLSAVETLGGCTCICSDKTGTLTQNKMTVESVCVGLTKGEPNAAAERELLTCIRICNTVKGSAGAYVGDPTEIALVEYADRRHFVLNHRVLGGLDFSSERKMMSVAASVEGKARLYVKGGADVLLKKCSKILTENGERALTASDLAAIERHTREYSSRAMRVLAFAVGEYRGGVREEELTFLGLAAMFDPPKEGAAEAVAACKKAGIKTVMITGDSAETAFAIAERLGIAKRRAQVITGEELDEMTEEQFARRVLSYRVYARVSPKHKSEIVKALQDKGEVVAMTGDGVNDAPSIKAADIGVAMGSGTDVTKNVADMVITDDDFSTMVHAVEEGRNVFYNVKKTISFFLSTNLAEVLSVLIVTLFLWKYDFLTSTQLLWINLITDSLPVLALGVERTQGAMERPPVCADDIFSKRSLLDMLFYGVMQTVLVVGLFVYGVRHWDNGAASTAAFLALSLCELFHAFNVRKERERITARDFFSNKVLLLTVVVGIAVNVLLVVVPFLCDMFALEALTAVQWCIVLCCSVAVVPLAELYKAVGRLLAGRTLKKSKRCIPATDSTQ